MTSPLCCWCSKQKCPSCKFGACVWTVVTWRSDACANVDVVEPSHLPGSSEETHINCHKPRARNRDRGEHRQKRNETPPNPLKTLHLPSGLPTYKNINIYYISSVSMNLNFCYFTFNICLTQIVFILFILFKI